MHQRRDSQRSARCSQGANVETAVRPSTGRTRTDETTADRYRVGGLAMPLERKRKISDEFELLTISEYTSRIPISIGRYVMLITPSDGLTTDEWYRLRSTLDSIRPGITRPDPSDDGE